MGYPNPNILYDKENCPKEFDEQIGLVVVNESTSTFEMRIYFSCKNVPALRLIKYNPLVYFFEFIE